MVYSILLYSVFSSISWVCLIRYTKSQTYRKDNFDWFNFEVIFCCYNLVNLVAWKPFTSSAWYILVCIYYIHSQALFFFSFLQYFPEAWQIHNNQRLISSFEPSTWSFSSSAKISTFLELSIFLLH